MRAQPGDVVAWMTELDGIECVVLAPSRSRARWATIRCARDAGYAVPFLKPVRVRRAAELDEYDAPTGACRSFHDAMSWARDRRNRRIDDALARADAVLSREARP